MAIPLFISAITEDPNYIDPETFPCNSPTRARSKKILAELLISHLSNDKLSSKDSLRICIGLLGLYS